jgi:hypothetical protein
MQVSRYAVGTVAAEDVIARVPFQVPKSPVELQRERREARATIPPTFNLRPAASDSMAARLDRFFDRVDSAAAVEGPSLAGVLERNSLDLTPSQEEMLREAGTRSTIRETALRAARTILPTGVADGSQLDDFETASISVREPGEQERSVDREDVLTAREFYDRAVELLPDAAPPDVQETLRLILIQFMEYSLELNLEATRSDQEGAERAVPEIDRGVLQGEAIVRANDPITPQVQETLEAYQDELVDRGLVEEGGVDLTPLLGTGVLNLLVLSIFGLFLYFFRGEIYGDIRWVSLMAILVAAFVAVTAVVASNELPYELLPVAFVALAVGILWDGRVALVLTFVLGVVVGLLPPFQPRAVPVIVTTLVGGAAAALAVRAVRRRAQAWVFGALVAGAYALGILALTLTGLGEGTLVTSVGAAAGNALVSALLAMGFIPLFEWFTGITTDQTLLEWADPNRELLKRLSLEAPGTYAHTINVANLAEAAAGAIGANGLLCRVGLYYHDVGKMLKPHYFVENQREDRNPHDRLKPEMSATIVRDHVVEGYEMAREEGVPEVVAAFIPEHHGTQRIGFFWERAKEEYGEENLDPDKYRYPGPRPRSRETAISMLADSVESATRALQDPTPDRVRDLIHSIVDGKIADGQLDEAPLTLEEIARIKDQFVKVLSGIYHHRIDYPQTKHLTDAPGGEGGEGAAVPDDGRNGGEDEDGSETAEVSPAHAEGVRVPDPGTRPAGIPPAARGEGSPGGDGAPGPG